MRPRANLKSQKVPRAELLKAVSNGKINIGHRLRASRAGHDKMIKEQKSRDRPVLECATLNSDRRHPHRCK
jgi:hypothetical protein